MKPENIKHGGSGSAYSNYGCRCDLCTEANTRRKARRQAQRRYETKDPNDPRHGTHAFYSNHSCRCEACTKANTATCKAYQLNTTRQRVQQMANSGRQERKATP